MNVWFKLFSPFKSRTCEMCLHTKTTEMFIWFTFNKACIQERALPKYCISEMKMNFVWWHTRTYINHNFISSKCTHKWRPAVKNFIENILMWFLIRYCSFPFWIWTLKNHWATAKLANLRLQYSFLAPSNPVASQYIDCILVSKVFILIN